MAAQIPATTKQWSVSSRDGSEGFNALKLTEVPVKPPGDSEVLVKCESQYPRNEDYLDTY